MLFTGDIALPSVSAVKLPDNLPDGDLWFGNLEGSLIDSNISKEEHRGVFNDLEAIKELSKQIPFKAFGIANNHLMDAANIKTTLNNLSHIGIVSVGAGNTIYEAQQSIPLVEKSCTYRILAFGWENISCFVAKDKSQGVNPYSRKNILKCVEDVLKTGERIICFMHWNYELELYPQPYDRQLAMDLIDMGVCAVIGCHAHRVQPIEFYKGRPIVYGLGNFLFKQGHYFDGNLRFPKFCEEEYVFELKGIEESFVLHHFHYDFEQNNLEFVKSEEISADNIFDGKAEFTGFTAKEYETWFKTHRVQKKLLPVFMAHETKVSYLVKSLWIKFRGKMINLLTKANLKSANRANRL